MAPSLTTTSHPTSNSNSNSNTTSPTLHAQSPSLPQRHSPHHQRTPSLGALAQELESEQEGQVNRLLGMIRQQRAQNEGTAVSPVLSPTASTVDKGAVNGATPESLFAGADAGAGAANRTRTPSGPSINIANLTRQASVSSSNTVTTNTATSTANTTFARPHPPPLSNRPSSSSLSPNTATSTSTSTPSTQPPYSLRPVTPSRTSSSNLDHRPLSATSAGPISGSTDDEIQYCRVETASLERENRMLRVRIGELEGLLSGGSVGVGARVLEAEEGRRGRAGVA